MSTVETTASLSDPRGHRRRRLGSLLVLLALLAALIAPAPVEAQTFRAGPDELSVVRLYSAYFLRAPDYGGRKHWENTLAAGTPLHVVSEQFARSAEFRSRYGTVDDEGFVRLVYQNVLGRQPDADGLAYWRQMLASGRSRGWVMLGFSDSPEYKSLTHPVGFIRPRVRIDPILDSARFPMFERNRTGISVAAAIQSMYGPVPDSVLVGVAANGAEMVDQFRSAFGFVPEWLPAAADSGSAWAYDGQAIFNNAAVNQDWPHIGKTIESTAAHEFGHIVHQFHRGTSGTSWAPTWLREGPAEIVGYSAGAAMGHSDPELLANVVRWAIHTDDRPLATIDVDSGPDGRGVDRFYLRSYAAAAYLAHTRGHQGVLVAYWQDLGRTDDPGASFQTVFGLTFAEFEREYTRYEEAVKAGGPIHLGLVTPPSGR